MNRTTKYRAWGHIAGEDEYRMFDSVCLYLFNGELMPANEDFTDPICDHVLMQYTGLNDQEGIEIYEGDILRPAMYKGIKTYNFPVVFKDGAFKLSGKLAGFNTLKESLSNAKKAKNHYLVIGNIHQNQSLINP